MKNFIIGVAAILLISSCAPSITKQRYRAFTFYQQNPNELAELCATNFPPKTVFKPGETIIKTDTVTNTVTDTLECPDGTKLECPPQKTVYINKYRTDTLEVENTALVAALQYKNQELSTKLYEEEVRHKLAVERAEDAEKKSKRKTWIIIALSAFIGYGVLSKLRII